MDVDKTMSLKNLNKFAAQNNHAAGFKAVLEQKRAVKEVSLAKLPQKAGVSGFNHVINDMVNNHEMAKKTIKTFMNTKDHSFEKVLAIQYQAGKLFLHEQMFSKTVEVSANALKTFTQMQV